MRSVELGLKVQSSKISITLSRGERGGGSSQSRSHESVVTNESEQKAWSLMKASKNQLKKKISQKELRGARLPRNEIKKK